MAAIPFLLAEPRFVHALGPPIPGPARSMFFFRFNEESGRLDARYSASLDASQPLMAFACQASPLAIATPNTARLGAGRNIMVMKGNVSLYVATIGASESSCLSKMPRVATFGFRANGRPIKNFVHPSKYVSGPRPKTLHPPRLDIALPVAALMVERPLKDSQRRRRLSARSSTCRIIGLKGELPMKSCVKSNFCGAQVGWNAGRRSFVSSLVTSSTRWLCRRSISV
eukprot:scaffold45952_cov93-Phaeocystis_antarctica.AAC.2